MIRFNGVPPKTLWTAYCHSYRPVKTRHCLLRGNYPGLSTPVTFLLQQVVQGDTRCISISHFIELYQCEKMIPN